MTKSQFNVKISKELLTQVKRQAMISGKSLTEHITDLLTKSLSENNIQIKDSHTVDKIRDLDERLFKMESIVSNLDYLSKKHNLFTNSEAINCTEFMRGLFNQEVEKKNIKNKLDAFNELMKHINASDKINNYFVQRLNEIMLRENPTPWTGKELNNLVSGDKCNCPIRQGLIKWTGKKDIPSQQEICDKGVKLIISF